MSSHRLLGWDFWVRKISSDVWIRRHLPLSTTGNVAITSCLFGSSNGSEKRKKSQGMIGGKDDAPRVSRKLHRTVQLRPLSAASISRPRNPVAPIKRRRVIVIGLVPRISIVPLL
ncbi:hypothetical protein MRX96_057918 [Rhipicephalus microplus]